MYILLLDATIQIMLAWWALKHTSWDEKAWYQVPVCEYWCGTYVRKSLH